MEQQRRLKAPKRRKKTPQPSFLPSDCLMVELFLVETNSEGPLYHMIEDTASV